MNLADRALKSTDQIVLNRVAAACLHVALEKDGRKERAIIADAGKAAAKLLTPILCALPGGEWMIDDEALLEGVRQNWGRIA